MELKVSEIIARLNSGGKVPDIAHLYGVHKKTVSNRILKLGYHYDKKTRKYRFQGSKSQEKEVDKLDFMNYKTEEVQKIFGKSSENPAKKVPEKTPKKLVAEFEELSLTQEEIKYLKELYRFERPQVKRLKLAMELAELPPKKPEKKVPYIISEETFEKFKGFCASLENDYRTTQNELVEAALLKFMKDFQGVQSK